MKKVLVLTASNPANNPRPRRIIEALRGSYELFALGIGSGDASKDQINGVQTFHFPSYQKRNKFQEAQLYLWVLLRRWEKLIWTKNRLEIVPILEKYDFDLIICFDLPLLPIVLMHKKRAKVVFDAQEYFPLWLTSDFRWKILFQRFNEALCREFLPQADCVLSVSPSFVERYAKEYNIKPKLYLSLPYFYDLPPKECDPKDIRILYHGSLSNNRSIDGIVALADSLPSHLSLHLVLVGGEKNYRQKIVQMIKQRQERGKKITLLNPVAFEEIVPFGNAFDIGLYFMPPKTFNLLATLPNKFFEYIGSSLAVISTPNPDVARMIKRYGVGKVSEDFSLDSMKKMLEGLEPKEIMQYKQASYKASQTLNHTQNQKLILKILRELEE